MSEKFKVDLREGLLKNHNKKSIPSKYLYDDRGSYLFEQITYLDEYYLTRLEKEILVQKLPRYILSQDIKSFNLVEIGAGDGQKSVALLQKLFEQNLSPSYFALDISQKALDKLEGRLKSSLRDISYDLLCADYEEGLETIARRNDHPCLILFLGSSIGNFSREDSVSLLESLKRKMRSQDRLLVGFDLVKDIRAMELAYDDPKGLTASFNLNLLERINKELGADFEVDGFEHVEFFNPQEKRMESYLQSRLDQTVNIPDVGIIEFEGGERILTEYSYKYDDESIDDIGSNAGLKIVWKEYDATKGFALVAFEKIR